MLISTRKVIERLNVLSFELESMREVKNGKRQKQITITIDPLIYDIYIAVFGHRKGKRLWKQHTNAID